MVKIIIPLIMWQIIALLIAGFKIEFPKFKATIESPKLFTALSFINIFVWLFVWFLN